MSWEHRGVTIEINHNGQFTFDEKVEDGTVTAVAASLELAKAQVDKYLKRAKPEDLNLRCMLVTEETVRGSSSIRTIRKAIITGVNGTTGGLRYKPKFEDVHFGPFPDLDSIAGDLMEYVRLMLELDQIKDKLAPYVINDHYSYGRIDAGNMPAKVDELLIAYEQAKRGMGNARRK